MNLSRNYYHRIVFSSFSSYQMSSLMQIFIDLPPPLLSLAEHFIEEAFHAAPRAKRAISFFGVSPLIFVSSVFVNLICALLWIFCLHCVYISRFSFDISPPPLDFFTTKFAYFGPPSDISRKISKEEGGYLAGVVGYFSHLIYFAPPFGYFIPRSMFHHCSKIKFWWK